MRQVILPRVAAPPGPLGGVPGPLGGLGLGSGFGCTTAPLQSPHKSPHKSQSGNSCCKAVN